ADLQKPGCQEVELARQQLRDREALGLIRHLLEGPSLASEVGIEARHRRLAGGIDEESAEQVQKLVPGRARDRPARGQLFVRCQDLLDYDPGSWRRLLQAAQVLLRVAQTVGVVDAQSSDHTGGQPAQNHAVCGQKNVLVLDANRSQGVDVEE